MLFNSYAFIFAFLPVAAVGFFLLARLGKGWGAGWLALCSLFFYGWWDARYLLLLGGSIMVNYAFGMAIAKRAGSASARFLLATAIAFNLMVLSYYKYADFFIASGNRLLDMDWSLLGVVLPIGISFFTFTQIAFLVDAYQGKVAEYRFVYYALFVTYFPHLIAGPVLHHREMMPQFDMDRNYALRIRNVQIGLTIFVIGLAKKVLIADNLAPYANPLFMEPGNPGLLLAWGGVLAYTFQLYFDFSGYSDMAIGLSRLFGVRLPLNFHSPYKATSIIEFWRRWHMTLSRFLRDYLYVPLGGNRRGSFRRHLNLMITMILGGLWHGAGWTFVAWGALHGVYLGINHAWRAATAGIHWPAPASLRRAFAAGTTFVAVVLAWTFFRSPDFQTAWRIVEGMLGVHGVGMPAALGAALGPLKPWMEQVGVEFYLGGGARFVGTYGWVMVAAAVAFLAPNTQQLMRRFDPVLPDRVFAENPGSGLAWKPSAAWALGIGMMATGALLSLSRPTEFLYFQF
jgi:D-alanyl-lipoteichoic acid acyltransferase DltB (MBOAT superfamily)